MDNKVAGDLDYVMPADACADDDVLLERKKDMHLREVNANEYYCHSSEPLSPVKTPEDRGDGESDGAESVCTERRNSRNSVQEDDENQVGVSSVSTSSSSQENVVTDDKSSPAVSTEELDKEISSIRAQINALDEISESEYSHLSDEEGTSYAGDKKHEPHEASMRSLVQIRDSLEEKVRNLREEKYVSDEKIRMAQEEEELRVREKIKLRQQLLIHRKERLKKCISDLKRKLDNQSHRLQTGYSSLLALQKTIFRSRSFSAKSRPPRGDDRDIVEAPF